MGKVNTFKKLEMFVKRGAGKDSKLSFYIAKYQHKFSAYYRIFAIIKRELVLLYEYAMFPLRGDNEIVF